MTENGGQTLRFPTSTFVVGDGPPDASTASFGNLYFDLAGWRYYGRKQAGAEPWSEPQSMIGLSAYEVAVEYAGFTGTEVEWLQSLVGPQGTSLEFVWDGTSLGIRYDTEDEYVYRDLLGVGLEFDWDGTSLGIRREGGEYEYVELKGNTGDSAYAQAVSEGYQGSLSEWLASLEGSDGVDGRGFNPRGEWVSGTTYATDDIVTYSGAVYRRSVESSNTLAAPTNTNYWEVWAEKGETGDPGLGIPEGGLEGQYITRTSAGTQWETHAGTRDGHPLATTTENGFQSAADKTKINELVTVGPGFFAARALITSSVTQAGIPDPSVTDNVAVAAGDNVLDVGNTNAARRGPWTIRSGGWARPQTWSTRARHIMVTEGALHADREYKLTTPEPITLNSTALSFMRSDVGRAEAYTDQRIDSLQRVQPNFMYGLGLTWVSPTEVTVSPGSAYVPSIGDVVSVSGTTTISTSGTNVNGSIAANTLYYVYLIGDGTVLAFSGSAFSPVPYSQGAKQSAGSSSRRYLGSICTDNNGAWMRQKRVGDNVYYLTSVTGPHNLRAEDTSSLPAQENRARRPLRAVPDYAEAAYLVVKPPDAGGVDIDYDDPTLTRNRGFIFLAGTSFVPVTVPLPPNPFFVYIPKFSPSGRLIIDTSGYVDTVT